MSNPRKPMIMQAQYKLAMANPHEYIKFYMSEEKCDIWYAVLSGFSGDEDEYLRGEYIVRIEFPDEFPFKPPHFYFMTEQGLYGVETKVCISIGEYHSDQYRAALKGAGFVNQLVSGLIGWRDIGGGIQILKTTIQKKKSLALDSCAANRANHPALIRKINDNFLDYSKRWKPESITAAIQAKIDESTPKDDE